MNSLLKVSGYTFLFEGAEEVFGSSSIIVLVQSPALSSALPPDR